LVEHDRVRLFTDFRYASAARAVAHVEFVQTSRSLIRSLAQNVRGRVAFEAAATTFADWRVLADAGLELVPTTGLVERLRAIKTPDEVERLRAACAITDAVYAATAEERFVGRTERELAWRMESLFHHHGA